MKLIDVDFTYGIAEKFDYCLENDPDLNDPETVADGRRLDDRDEIIVEFIYPLRRKCRRTLRHAGGFTRLDFAIAVSDAYAAIYAEEEASRTLSPEPKGMLYNRSETDGVHGIVAHGIGDLVLEGAHRDQDGIWHLDVGS